jgi:hypothetical protein
MGLTREQVEMWRDDLCRRYGTAAIPLCDLAHKGLQVEAIREAIGRALPSIKAFINDACLEPNWVYLSTSKVDAAEKACADLEQALKDEREQA